MQRDHDIGRLDVAVDDSLLVGMLDGMAYIDEQAEAGFGRELVLVAELGDRHPLDQLHDEVGPAGGCGSGVEHAGNVGVVHEGQRLPLRLEVGDDLGGIHARLDDLEGDHAADGLHLFGHVDDAEAALADLLEEFVRANDRPGAFGERDVIDGAGLGCRRIEEVVRLGVGAE